MNKLKNAIRRLKNGKSASIDGVHVKMVKKNGVSRGCQSCCKSVRKRKKKGLYQKIGGQC